MKTKLKELREKYDSWRIELEKRVQELSAKGQYDIMTDREIHLRYVNQLIEDVDEILNVEIRESEGFCECPDEEEAPIKWICTKCNKPLNMT